MEQIQCKSSCHRCIGLGSRRWCLSFQTGGNTSQNVADSGLLRENSTRGFFPLCLWVQSGFEANGPFLLLHPVSCCHCCFFFGSRSSLRETGANAALDIFSHMVYSSASYVGWVADEEHQEEKKQLYPAQALTAGITAMYSK